MRTALLAAFFLSVASATVSADARSDAAAHVKFGIKVAQSNLWREAASQFERATEIDPTYAAAWNNLAIALEHQGLLEDAKRAYERAAKIDPGNVYIQQNHELFKEIHDRAARQSRR